MRLLRPTYWLHLLMFISIALALYGTLFPQWADHVLGTGEDGFKNFYTLSYYLEYGESAFVFNGMNHPFGEHILFTDNQPLLAWILKILNTILPIHEHLGWILPLLLILSFQLGSWLFYKAMKNLEIASWPALFASIFILLISPQWIRLSGHYSLAHGIIIPAVLYALTLKGPRSFQSALLVLLPFLSAWVHPYFLIMTSLFIGAYLFLEKLLTSHAQRWKDWIRVFLIPLASILLFQGVMWVTDSIDDRPEVPYGFIHYRATLPSLLLPFYDHLLEPIRNWSESFNMAAAEGSFYIGTFALIGGMSALALMLFRGLQQHGLNDDSERKNLFVLLASVPLLLLSIGFPFCLEDFEKFLHYTGPLRQFRGIGRFSFIFFYAINFFAAVVILKRIHHIKLQGVILSLIAVIFIMDVFYFSQHIRRSTTHGVSIHGMHKLALNAADFDAILPLPYYHAGSENFRTQVDQHFIYQTQCLSLETGLPLISGQMSRTSLEQTTQLLQLSRSLISPPPFLSQVLDERWLIMTPKQHVKSEVEGQLITQAKKVAEDDEHLFYSIEVASLEKLYASVIQEAEEHMADAKMLDGDVSSDSLVYRSFNDSNTTITFKGSGALALERREWTPLIPKRHCLQSTDSFELTFWAHYADPQAMNTQIWFWERNGDDDVEFWVAELGDKTIAFDHGWALCRILLDAASADNTFEVLLHRDKPMKIWVDEVLLRPLGQSYKTAYDLNLNNRYYKPLSQPAVE